MKTIILNSGVARRLKPLTDDLPKCLLEVNGKTILERQLECLTNSGIREIVITTGPFAEKIIEHVERRFPGLDVNYVNNPEYEVTNYIYSIWLAKDFLKDNILLLHGDMIFDCNLISKILDKKDGNYVLVNNKIEPPEKDFKALIKNERVSKIGVNYFGADVYFCAPIYKFIEKDFSLWLRQMEIFIKEGKDKCYAEDAFNEISEIIKLQPLYFGEESCMEVDSLEDLKEAQRIFHPSN